MTPRTTFIHVAFHWTFKKENIFFYVIDSVQPKRTTEMIYQKALKGWKVLVKIILAKDISGQAVKVI